MNTWEKARMIFFGIRISKSVITAKPDTAYTTIFLHTPDGLNLETWYIPVPSPKGTVILFHGYNGSKANVLAEANFFRTQGFSTLLPDFRASGNSDGFTCSVGYKEADDVELAYNYIRQHGEQHIILWGASMGASAILHAVPAYHLQPDKLILESPFATLTDAVKGRMRAVHIPPTPFAQMLTFWGGLEQGFWGPGFQPAADASQITIPTLLCWGIHDTRVMRHETDEIYNNLKTKKLLLFSQSGHESFCQHEPAIWKDNMEQFIQ